MIKSLLCKWFNLTSMSSIPTPSVGPYNIELDGKVYPFTQELLDKVKKFREEEALINDRYLSEVQEAKEHLQENLSFLYTTFEKSLR